jgi:transposase-like protein
MNREAQIQPQDRGNEDKNKNFVKCRWCKSMDIVKKGFRTTENRGKIQRYICRNCKRSFCRDDGFYRMRNSESKITSAIDLYFSNLSSRKVRNHFRRHLEHNSSHVTVLNWCRKYVLKVQNYVDSLEPDLSGQFYADETDIDCQKRNDVFWCNVDWDTRFISGFHYSTTREIKEAIEFLKKATEKKQIPKYIQTDAAPFYPRAMRKVFASNRATRAYHGGSRMKTEHRINNVFKTKKHNVRIETVFMKIKDRVDDFRGLKALWSAPILMAGIVLQHNFVEEHTTLRDYPCERAGLNLELENNRWLGLIKLSSIN